MAVSRVSVAICTWNRSALLEQTLEELTNVEIPPGITWELIVVNNNCTDATDSVLARFATRLPIKRLFQPIPGLSNARNLAVANATGEYVIWTDDDVLVARDWLVEYCRAFDRWPDAAHFGGLIEPWFPKPPPEWLVEIWKMVAQAYAAVDLGPEPRLFAPPREVPFGANMAAKTEVLRRFPYDPNLGVRPDSRAGGEETRVVQQMTDAGETGWWVPSVRVRHYVPPERQTEKYLERWYFGYGEYLGRIHAGPIISVFGRPRWLWKHLAAAEVRYFVNRRLRAPSEWIQDLKTVSIARGQFRGYTQRPTQRSEAGSSEKK
jgi:glycosyltransferase involved in cell wall biosynthesis